MKECLVQRNSQFHCAIQKKILAAVDRGNTSLRFETRDLENDTFFNIAHDKVL